MSTRLQPSVIRISLIAVLAFISLVIFYLFPKLDILVSRLLFDYELGTFINSGTKLENFYIYQVREKLYFIITAIFIILAINYRAKIINLIINFTILSVFSTWLLVNELIKNQIPRSRPRDLMEFGGIDNYSSIWSLTDGICITNCSFVSGDVAFVFSLYLIIYFLFYQHYDKSSHKRNNHKTLTSSKQVYRVIEFYLFALLIIFASAFVIYMRLSLGAHFLSDVIFGALISLASIELLLLVSSVFIYRANFFAK